MSLNTGKSPAFLLLLSWLAICSPTVFAQNEMSKPTASAESPARIVQFASETKANLFLKEVRADEPADLPDTFQKSARAEKNIYKISGDAETIRKINERSEESHQTENNDFAYHFRPVIAPERQLEFKDAPDTEKNR